MEVHFDMYDNPAEKNFNFARVPLDEDCDALFPTSQERVSQASSRPQLTNFIQILAFLTFTVFTSALCFYIGRNWDPASDGISLAKKISNYCKSFSCTKDTFTNSPSPNPRRRSSHLLTNSIQRLPPQRKHLPQTRKPLCRHRLGFPRRQLPRPHRSLFPRPKIGPRIRPSKNQPKVRKRLPCQHRRTTLPPLPQPSSPKLVV